jgi:hypothetical protein
MMKIPLVTLVLLAAFSTAGDTLAPKDDFLIAVQDTTLTITAADLLGNDGVAGPPYVHRISIASPPRYGTLRPTTGGYVYRGSAGYFGRDSFTYRISDGMQTSPPATVRIEVAPDYVGLTGDFDGDRENEWGWFDSAAATFHACEDYPGPNPRCWVLWAATASLAGRAPIVADWNRDGRDDVGLFDSRTGWFHLRTLGAFEATTSFRLGAGGGIESPLAGDWNGDGRQTVGLYRAAESRFQLRNQSSSGPFDYDFTFGATFADRRAFAAPWPQQGVDAVAIHSGESVYRRAAPSGRVERVSIGCPTHPNRIPIELTAERGLIVYDFHLDRAERCGRLGAPVTVYLPPD